MVRLHVVLWLLFIALPWSSYASSLKRRSHAHVAGNEVNKAEPLNERNTFPDVSSVRMSTDDIKATEETPKAESRSGASLTMVKTAIRVVDKEKPIENNEGVERIVSKEEVETSAGTFGDPSRYIQLLPGVVSDNDQYNDFIVRGGVPEENLFIVDNIEIPSINHLALSDTTGGFVSMIDNAAIKKLSLHTDAYDSKYDQRLSSIVDISTKSDEPPLAHSESEIGISGMGASSNRPIHNTGSLFVSARRSILNYFTHDIGMNGVPIYTNSLIRADDHLNERDSWWMLSLAGIDSLKIRPSATDFFETNPYDIDYKGWRNTIGVNWQHISSARAFSVLSFSNSEQSQTILQNAQLIDNATIYSENTRDGTSAAKLDWSFQKNQRFTLSAGARVAVDRIDYHIRQPLGLQNPYSADPSPRDAMSLSKQFAVFSSAGYAELGLMLPHNWKAVAGARISQWAIVGTEVFTPKLLIMMPLAHRIVHLGYAEYAQLPPNLYLLSFSNQKYLSPIRSHQMSVGVDLAKTHALDVSIEAYEKRYLNYPVAENYKQLSLGNVADTFGQAFMMFPMTNMGRGLARGAELSVQCHLGSRVVLNNSSTYSRVWYSGMDGVLRRGNYDLPLVSNIAGTVRVRTNGTISFRYSGSTGRPYTPDDLLLSEAQNREVYDLSKINSKRGPTYHRLDFRYQQSHEIGRGTLLWHIGLENALGNENFYSYSWAPRAGKPRAFVQTQMPRFPDGGIKYSF